MVAAVKQIVTVQRGGVIRLQSSELIAGDRAEVIVLVRDRVKRRNGAQPESSTRARTPRPIREVPIARLTKQVRGDIAEANRIRQAIREGRERLIPWEQVKRDFDQR